MKFCQRAFKIAAVCALFMGTSALRADTVVFDPDGVDPVADAFNINAFHLGSGNSLMRAVLPFSVGSSFQLLFQAHQSFVVGSGNSSLTFEITILGSVTERVTTANTGPPSRLTFELSKNQATDSFIEIYSNSPPDAVDLDGTGFNDGTLIVRASPVSPLPNVGTFCLTDPQPSPPPSFDVFGPDDYPGITSIVGAGATRLNLVVGYVDSRFFPAPSPSPAPGSTIRQLRVGDVVTIDIGQAAPFNGVNPSGAFTASPNPGTGALPSPTATPLIGTVNGISGPDVQTQGPVVISFAAPTPTPSGTPGVTPTPAVPKVIVSASRTQLREGGDSTITFSANSPNHPDLTINYSVGGPATLNVDYTLTGTLGQVVIPSGQTTTSIVLHAIEDTVNEPNGEGAKITLLPGTGYFIPDNKKANRVVVLILDKSG